MNDTGPDPDDLPSGAGNGSSSESDNASGGSPEQPDSKAKGGQS
jgi:hypothetical protein